MPVINETEQLPHVPSALILLALEDLEKAEQAEGVEVEMGVFHHSQYGVCHVCLAGAVMRRFVSDSKTVHLTDFSPHNSRAFDALDAFRLGAVRLGIDALRLPMPPGIPTHAKVAQYHADHAAFKSDMRNLAATLVEHGL